MANNANFITFVEEEGNTRIEYKCPKYSPVYSNITSDRADTIILIGTDKKIYCFSYSQDIPQLLDEATRATLLGSSGFFTVDVLPVNKSLESVIEQLRKYHPEDTATIEALDHILNPPEDPTIASIPDDFLTLLKKVGQCIAYMNEDFDIKARAVPQTLYGEKNETGAYYLGPSKLSTNEVGICRSANMIVYFKMIEDYMSSQSEEIRTLLDNLPFEGYKGRSGLFNTNIQAGRKLPREITFGEFRRRIMKEESCMGTFAGNIIAFYNYLCLKKGKRDAMIDKTILISDSVFAAQCPAIKMKRENIQETFKGGKRKNYRKTKKQSIHRKRKTRQNKRKN